MKQNYHNHYMCEILEDEKKTCQNRSFTCSSDQFTYKQVFVTESTVDSCFNKTAF
jgi:hypothetical protein